MRSLVLLVSPEIDRRACIARGLQSQGFAIELASDGKRALALTGAHKFKVAILLFSSEQEALYTMLALRDRVPRIILLSDCRDAIDRLGRSVPQADYVLLDETNEKHVVNRIVGLIGCPSVGTTSPIVTRVLQLGNCMLDLPGHVFISDNGDHTPLTRAETELLGELARNPGQTVSRDRLRVAITPRRGTASDEGVAAFDRSIDMLVARLRRKIESDPKAPHFLLTVPGIGYKLVVGTPVSDTRLQEVKPIDPEIRTITALCCNLVGTVALAIGSDPEDFGRLTTSFQNAVSSAITRMGGTIAYVTPDHILGIFGFPAAHEDDAERAVLAGLDSVAAVGQILSPTRQPLHLRAGIATGLALANQQQTSGEPATLATALSDLTPIDSVTVTANTRRLLGDNFRCDGLERYVLVGLAEPVDTYRVRARRVVASRFRARRPSSLLQLVNRERELQLLWKLWEQTKQRRGQVAAIIGEAGIGKSHLCEYFLEQITEPHQTLRYQCSPHHLNDPFHPVISQIEYSIGLKQINEPELKFEKLRKTLMETTATTSEDVRHYANLLSIATKQQADVLRQTTPQRQRNLLITALVRNLQKLAERRLLIIVVADAHWIDPSSLELLEGIIFAITSSQIFLIVKFRPEFKPPWLGESHVTTIQLARLTHDQGTALISQLTGDTKLDRDIQAEIIDKADGVPLFIEEITKSILESDLLQEIDGHYVARNGLEPLEVPRSIVASLTARLDRLGPAREIAQVASAIGRAFSQELLAAVAAKSGDALQAALNLLIAAELIFVKEKTPKIIYAFKHALLREAAYASMVRSKRQLLHRRVANILESRFPDTCEAQPGLLAHHLAEAGLILPAVKYLQKAGRRSLERSANLEAIRQLTRALELMQSDSDGAQDKAVRFDLEATLSQSLIARYGYAAPETRNGLLRARALFAHSADEAQKFSVLYGIWASNYVGGELSKQQHAAAEFLKEAEETSNDALKCMAQRIAGTTELTVGAFKSALIHLNQARALYDPSRHGDSCHQYGQDIGASALCYLSLALWHVGLVNQAFKIASSAVAFAEKLAHPHTLVYTLCHARGLMDVLSKRRENVHLYAASVDSLCQENGFAHWANFATILSGWGATGRGEADLGLTLIKDGRTAWQKAGAQLWMPLFLLLEAQASLEADKPEGALKAVEEAITICEGGGESWALAEVLRTKASILQSRKASSTEIETALLKSIKIARRQGALFWELRASCELSLLWRRRGKNRDALKLLRPVYDMFTEGFEVDELRQAHELLRQLEEAVH